MRRLLVGLLAIAYLACVALGIAAVWTSRGIDLSSALGATAGVIGLAVLVGIMLGCVAAAILDL